MARWRAKAIELLPEMRNEIQAAETPMGLWIEVCAEFALAYKDEPRNDDFIRHVYSYANWCRQQPRSDEASRDLFTCVVVCFYEHVAKLKASRQDMHRWFTKQEVDENRDVLGYLLDPDEFDEMLELFDLKPVKSKHPAKKPGEKRR
jgi:hypothetical protein